MYYSKGSRSDEHLPFLEGPFGLEMAYVNLSLCKLLMEMQSVSGYLVHPHIFSPNPIEPILNSAESAF